MAVSDETLRAVRERAVVLMRERPDARWAANEACDEYGVLGRFRLVLERELEAARVRGDALLAEVVGLPTKAREDHDA